MRAKVTAVFSLLFFLSWPTLGAMPSCGACATPAPEVPTTTGVEDHSCCKEASPASEPAIQKGHCCFRCVQDLPTNAHLSRRAMILKESESTAYWSKVNGVNTVSAMGLADPSVAPSFLDPSPNRIKLKSSGLYLFDCTFRI